MDEDEKPVMVKGECCIEAKSWAQAVLCNFSCCSPSATLSYPFRFQMGIYVLDHKRGAKNRERNAMRVQSPCPSESLFPFLPAFGLLFWIFLICWRGKCSLCISPNNDPNTSHAQISHTGTSTQLANDAAAVFSAADSPFGIQASSATRNGSRGIG